MRSSALRAERVAQIKRAAGYVSPADMATCAHCGHFRPDGRMVGDRLRQARCAILKVDVAGKAVCAKFVRDQRTLSEPCAAPSLLEPVRPA